ncbi:hypothetical protein [Pseudomonas marginalis]|jgi:type IV secretory pathway TrbL component
MNVAQKELVEKTLYVLGYVLLVVVVLMLVIGVSNDGIGFFEEAFDSRSPTVLVWPVLVAAALCLWFRAFIKASRQ